MVTRRTLCRNRRPSALQPARNRPGRDQDRKRRAPLDLAPDSKIPADYPKKIR